MLDENQHGFLRLNSLVEGESEVLPVIVGINEQVRDLKKAIQHERKNGLFKNVNAHDLALGMVDIDLETHDEDHLSNLKLEGIKKLQAWRPISWYWKDQPPYDHLHIIVKAQAATSITPSLSQNTNISKDMPQYWLNEMHKKLWGKHELFGKIFRTAKLTKADFIELQLELQRIDPSRGSPSYMARKVLDVKANFLRKKSDPMEFDILDSRLLVPSVSPVPDDAMNIDANVEAVPQFDNCRYIFDDAAELSMGSAAVFPCTIRYMDLTTLELKDLSRVPHLMLIRDEWDIMIEMFNRRERGMGGSAVFTGSPGIGKTCLLYYILILCLIRSQPVVFQDKHRDLFLITKTVLPQTTRRQVVVEGDDVLTLVDADGECCIPHKYILRHNLRILLTSSLRTGKDRKWLTQDIQDPRAAYVMSPWLQEEWLVASLFIAEKDITLRRFWETTHICGFVPRDFLSAVQSLVTLEDARMKISAAITTCQDIQKAINGVAEDLRFPHRVFVVYPCNERRSLIGCLVEPISEYAMDTIIMVLDDQSADAAFDLYESIQGSSHAVTFRDRIWERKVHWYFRRTFTIRSLDDTAPSEPFIIRSLDDNSVREWDLSKVTVKHFGPLQMVAGELTERVTAGESIYLKSTSGNFASLDSIIYQLPDSLVGIQTTIAPTYPIKTKGLSALQRSLKPNNKPLSELLSPLLPTVEKPWTLLFVVPKPMENSFDRQDITGADNAGWSKKTKQYVLGLDQREVFRAQSTFPVKTAGI